jgi:hypothetical protein
VTSDANSVRLTSADLPPAVEGASLPPLGLPPRWSDLPRLWPRPVFTALWPVFADWRRRVTETPGPAPAVFCLCGPTGDGKSALLLQLAAAMLRENIVPALRLWEACDDPRRFDPPPPDDVAWHFIDRLPQVVHGATGETWLRRLRELPPPRFIVTTASPLALDWFAKRYPKKFALTTWPLPLLSAAEATALATAAGRPAEADLWREGMTLENFLFAAQSPAALIVRLESLDVEWLPAVVAANLLDLAVPLSLLKPEKQPLAQQLAEQGRLPVRTAADGLRLLTPGLAQPLLEHWFPEIETRLAQIAEGFTQILEIWLREKKAVAAAWFLRRLLHSEHLPRLLPPRTRPVVLHHLRKNLCREFYRRHRALHGDLPAVELLSAWMDVGQTFRLKPDVMEDAVKVLDGRKDALTPALATDIWLHSEYRKNPLGTQLRQRVAEFFKHTQADAGAALVKLYAETCQNEPALPVMQLWLETHPFHPRFGNALETLLAKPFRRAQVHGWAMECLGFHWRGKAAGKPLAVMLQHNSGSEPLRKCARQWLGENAIYPDAGGVLRGLLADGKGGKAEVGQALLWTTKFPVHAAAGELWEILLEHHAGQPEVRQVAMEWLKACPQHPQAAAMLLAIARREKSNPAFVAAVQSWLTAHAAHAQTPVLLETLASSTDESIRRVLAQWLDENPQHPAAARLLAGVLCAGKIAPDWMQRAETMLQSGHPDALRVLRALLGTSANDAVLKLAWEGLPRAPLPEQKKLCRSLGKLAGQQPERVAALRQGLPDAELASEFFHSLRETLWDMPAVQLADWMQRGFARLAEADQQWMFQRLLEQDTPLPAPFSIALAEWLQRNVKTSAYREMTQLLRQYPRQGRYFHSASMLPLQLLADVMG